jgi:Polyketide cyclase / dehydrase and lipid transport
MEISSNHSYRFPAPRRVVWAALADVSAYPSWWPWLRRFEATGAGLAEGAVWRCTIRPPLPYAIRCSVELTYVRAPALVTADITGDILGHARLDLTQLAQVTLPYPSPSTGEPHNLPGHSGTRGRARPGPATEARITSRLEARHMPARLLAGLAPSAARWGHDWVFDTAARQFARAALRFDP